MALLIGAEQGAVDEHLDTDPADRCVLNIPERPVRLESAYTDIQSHADNRYTDANGAGIWATTRSRPCLATHWTC